nr:MAG TPA: hypothetical protein [Bacteriophage sp.]
MTVYIIVALILAMCVDDFVIVLGAIFVLTLLTIIK